MAAVEVTLMARGTGVVSMFPKDSLTTQDSVCIVQQEQMDLHYLRFVNFLRDQCSCGWHDCQYGRHNRVDGCVVQESKFVHILRVRIRAVFGCYSHPLVRITAVVSQLIILLLTLVRYRTAKLEGWSQAPIMLLMIRDGTIAFLAFIGENSILAHVLC